MGTEMSAQVGRKQQIVILVPFTSNHPLGREKDFETSTSSAAAVSPTKENHTGHSPHLQGLSDDETGKRTASTLV